MFQDALPVISIHPSRVGWDLSISGELEASLKFQSTHPVWDGTSCHPWTTSQHLNFNPPIPCGMGPSSSRRPPPTGAFQSTHPVWDGTRRQIVATRKNRDFNPPIPCGMGPALAVLAECTQRISIHPSRVGWDSKKYMITYISCDSYPFCQIFRLHKMTAYSYS